MIGATPSSTQFTQSKHVNSLRKLARFTPPSISAAAWIGLWLVSAVLAARGRHGSVSGSHLPCSQLVAGADRSLARICRARSSWSTRIGLWLVSAVLAARGRRGSVSGSHLPCSQLVADADVTQSNLLKRQLCLCAVS